MAMVPRLIAEEGVLAGTQIALQDNQSWVIGSDTSSCEVILQEDGIGAQQAEITLDVENGSYAIRNLNLATPLLVNDISITEEEYVLEEGDVITLGGSVFRFFTNEEDLVFFDAEDGTSSQGGGSGQSDNSPQQDDSETFKNESNTEAPPLKEKKASNSSPPLNKQEEEPVMVEQEEEILPVQSLPPSSSKLKKQELPIEDSEAISIAEMKKMPEVEMMEPTKVGKSKKNKKSILPDEQEEPVINPDEEPSAKVASQGAPARAVAPEIAVAASISDAPATEVPVAQPQEVKPNSVNEEAQIASPPPAAPQEEEPKPPEEVIKPTLPEEQHLPAENAGEQFKIQDLFAFDDGIFEDKEKEDSFVDLARTSRFLLKVIAGPNVGAEFGLDPDHTYTIGTDTTICDIIFNDLSVSHKHAQLKVSATGQITLEDLQSRNGVLLDGRRIKELVVFPEGAFASLGTTVFSVIDREHPAETLVAGSFFKGDFHNRKTEDSSSGNEGFNSDSSFMDEERKGNTFSSGILIMALLIGGLAILFGIGTASLFGEKEVRKERIDFHHEIHNIVKYFPAVNFSYNKVTGELFLSGHVRTGLERNELLHNLTGLAFIKVLEDYVVDDESVWQEMNLLLVKQRGYKGVTMHSPEPGKFVITGYLKTEAEATTLTDYIHLNFSYSSLLDNQVVVEESVAREIGSKLIQKGFIGVASTFVSGEVSFTGFANITEQAHFSQLATSCQTINGVRNVKNTVVFLGNEQDIIDLNKRYPKKYQVSGFSKLGEVVVNVVINGKILARGDVLEGMIVTGIQPTTIFFEKDNLKYKLNYNK
ncbi:Uncharacterized protein CLAVI_000281 [Candidatus Clavichlamydia salmonicola]|uniref:type III secretion system inner membrane ring subunit SctD n=1 Tax=Candidatus Clavichlamydia salmonicola TaxID=469812 RepID=UPI001891A5BE|nr:type III secretion system inner membrane ring subunit SctD [Candidatus Clavichlamydia salmonicola]MBF5050666.1 Uncharacterized protein [Candidatus Clavichlamydia salmonicola]